MGCLFMVKSVLCSGYQCQCLKCCHAGAAQKPAQQPKEQQQQKPKEQQQQKPKEQAQKPAQQPAVSLHISIAALQCSLCRLCAVLLFLKWFCLLETCQPDERCGGLLAHSPHASHVMHSHLIQRCLVTEAE